MAEVSEARRHVPWEVRLCAVLPIPPLATGALVFAVATAASFLYYELAIGSPMWDPEASGILSLSEGRRSSLLAALLGGYVIGGFGHAAIALGRDLTKLGVRDAAAPMDVPATTLARSRFFGVLGIGAMWAFTIGVQAAFSKPMPWLWLGELAPFALLQTTNGWLIGRVSYFALVANPDLRAVAEPGEIDLLDLRPTRVLGRIALRHALLFIIGISLLIPWMLAIPFASQVFGALIATALVIPVLLLALPVRGVRRRIRAAKAAALEELDAELRRVRDAAIPAEKGTAGRLADLLAYRAYVVSIYAWPFDSPTRMRFALYLLIPIGSWVGSAFVERVVNTTLD